MPPHPAVASKVLRTLQVIQFLSQEPPQRGTLRLQRKQNSRRSREIQTRQPGQISAPVNLMLPIKIAVLWGHGRCRRRRLLRVTQNAILVPLRWRCAAEMFPICTVDVLSVDLGRPNCREEDLIRDAGDDCDGVVELEDDGAYVA